ncbi:MAG: helix-turn-helix domain-containing protein [Bacteroidia bacterium]|jgi:transcriptional regulator with XRE-family HTH domain|nr:helix-turn-helix domain-containing protein [Bacteroidia bacterium]
MDIGHIQIGQKIKKLRELKNLTQDFMAAQLEMSQSAYSKIETGESDVTFKKLELIASALDVKPEDIVTFNERMVFNVQHNQTGNGLVINHMTDEMKKLYEELITQLREENAHLKSILDKVLGK